MQQVLLTLTGNEVIVAGFPNQSMSAAILEISPVTTATVARTFSSMKLIKTRLRSRMGDDILQHTMRIWIDCPDHLTDEILEQNLDHYRTIKKRKSSL